MCSLFIVSFIVVPLLFFATNKSNKYIYFYFENMDIGRRAAFRWESWSGTVCSCGFLSALPAP